MKTFKPGQIIPCDNIQEMDDIADYYGKFQERAFPDFNPSIHICEDIPDNEVWFINPDNVLSKITGLEEPKKIGNPVHIYDKVESKYA